jgi:hypothetical protein
MNSTLAPQIERRIFLIRGQRVMLDNDLADLYGVPTKQFNRAVRRNVERFPEGFMFQLTEAEWKILRCQTGTSSSGHGGRRFLPLAFTEQGVAMLSSVLNSSRAIQVNIAIIKIFVRLREMLASHTDLARKLADLERKYDSQFKIVFDAIRQLMTPLDPPRRRIGFHAEP